jgi:hypothetical protein
LQIVIDINFTLPREVRENFSFYQSELRNVNLFGDIWVVIWCRRGNTVCLYVCMYVPRRQSACNSPEKSICYKCLGMHNVSKHYPCCLRTKIHLSKHSFVSFFQLWNYI